MKRNQVLVSATFVLWLCGPAFGDPSPMVERRIFVPEAQEEVGSEAIRSKSPEAEKLERELVFTGVIIAPDGKRAMVKEKAGARGKESEKAAPLKEGDEIHGMTVKEIGRNYLILAGQSGDVKLNLFQQGKDRPAPPPEPKTVETPAATFAPVTGAQQGEASDQPQDQAGQPGQPPPTPKPGIPGQAPQTVAPTQAQSVTTGQETESPSSPTETAPQSNPFADALKKSQQQNVKEGRRNVVNPFLDAIRRSQGSSSNTKTEQ